MVNLLNAGKNNNREEHMPTAHRINYLYGSFSLLMIILFGLIAWGMIALA
jgi:hypothetical protein